MTSMQPAGWYDDPWHPHGMRYWNGTDWTPHAAMPAKGPHPTLPIQVAFGALLAMALPLIASRFILRGLADLRWPIAVYVVLAGVIAYGPPLAFWRAASRRWGSGRPLVDVGLRARWADLGWGSLTWLACVAAQVVVGLIVVATGIPFQNNTDQIRDARDSPGYVIPLLILAVVAAPIVEEIVFRGLVLRGLLSRLAPVAAVAAQGVLFGLAHFDPQRGVRNIGLVMVLGAVGCVLGGAGYLFRRLVPGMVAHAILNGVAMAVVLSGWTLGG